MKFTIAHPRLTGSAAGSVSYESLEQARQALRRDLGWPDIYLGPGYTTPDGRNQVWYAYAAPPPPDTATEDKDAPRITRLVEDV